MSRTYGKAQDLIDFTRASSGTALRRVKYGAELVTNGTFDSDLSGWNTGSNVTSVYSSGTAQLTFGGAITSTFNNWFSQDVLSIGKVYIVTFDATNVSGGYLQAGYGYHVGITVTTSGTYSFTVNSDYGNPIGKTNITFGGLTGAVWKIDNVSVKEVTFDTSDGDLILFNHPNNIPRIEYDANGNVLGLLVEESRTNLNTQSESYIGQYSLDNVTLTEGQSSPDGQANAVKLTLDTLSGNAAIQRGIVGTSVGTQYVVSAFVKKGENRYATLFGWGNGTNGIAFDIQELTYQINTSWDDGGIIDINDQWVRIWGAVTPLVSTSCYVGMVKDLSSSRAWVGGEYLTVFGIQVEQGSFPTSYIPTSGSTATRSADVASIGVDGFGFNNEAGTIFIESSQVASYSSNKALIEIKSPSVNDRLTLYSTTTNTAGFYVNVGGTASATLTTTSQLAEGGVFSKTIAAYAEDDFVLKHNDDNLQTDTSGSPPSGLTIVGIGSRASGGIENNMHIKSIKYYPRRLTNDQIEALTA